MKNSVKSDQEMVRRDRIVCRGADECMGRDAATGNMEPVFH
ncbi:MAG: hypothetical protein NUV55_05455 [Sulfuricaulis sp.]|nr:hypothetical protein [Sulfuricaulis sp.]